MKKHPHTQDSYARFCVQMSVTGAGTCVFWCEDDTLRCVCGAYFHAQSFLKVFTLANCSRLFEKQAGIRRVNVSTDHNHSQGSLRIQHIISTDDSPVNHCTQRLLAHHSLGRKKKEVVSCKVGVNCFVSSIFAPQ